MATRDSDEFKQFVEECRQLGLADMKALEAAWDQYAAFLPESAWGKEFREKLMLLLKRGAEYARLEEQLRKGQADGS